MGRRATERVDTALVLAAGRSTRIQAAVPDLPKPLIALGGQTILERNLRALAGAGVNTVWINLNFEGQQIEHHIGDGSRFSLQVHYSREPRLLGTAGAAKRLEYELGGGAFYVVYADNLTSLDLPTMAQFHRLHGASATIALFDPTRVRNTGIAGGRVSLNPHGRIARFEEGPGATGTFVNAGVYVLEPEVVGLIPDDRPADFGHDMFPMMLARGTALAGYQFDGYCLAVDTPDALALARRFVAEEAYVGALVTP